LQELLPSRVGQWNQCPSQVVQPNGMN